MYKGNMINIPKSALPDVDSLLTMCLWRRCVPAEGRAVNQASKSGESEQTCSHRLCQLPHFHVSVVHVLFPSADTGIYSGCEQQLKSRCCSRWPVGAALLERITWTVGLFL